MNSTSTRLDKEDQDQKRPRKQVFCNVQGECGEVRVKAIALHT